MTPAELRSFFVQNGYVGAFSLPRETAVLTRLKQGLEQQRWRTLLNKLSRDRAFADKPFPAKTAYLSSKLVFDLATESAILDHVSLLLGSDLLLWIAETVTRPPSSAGQKWHVDSINAFLAGVHVSVAITDMNTKNGCVNVIPKTHTYNVDLRKLAKNGECDLRDDDSLLRLADRLHPENAPHSVVPVQVRAGEYFFTKGGLWHGVGRNRTLGTRMALVARYATPETHVTDPGGKPIPCILVKGEDHFGLNDLRTPPTD